jgi:hypothetical protein
MLLLFSVASGNALNTARLTVTLPDMYAISYLTNCVSWELVAHGLHYRNRREATAGGLAFRSATLDIWAIAINSGETFQDREVFPYDIDHQINGRCFAFSAG